MRILLSLYVVICDTVFQRFFYQTVTVFEIRFLSQLRITKFDAHQCLIYRHFMIHVLALVSIKSMQRHTLKYTA